MAKRKIMFSVVCVIAAFTAWVFAEGHKPAEKEHKTKVRIGVFDSRAVAIAYAHSAWNQIDAKTAEMKKAKADNNKEKIKELEAWGSAQQAKLHKQGFGTAPVHDLLKHIKNDIPKIAKKAGVDIIVSKWEVVYQNPSIELIDITDEIVKPFSPGEKTLKSIQSIQTHQPFSQEELEKMDNSH